LPVHPRTKASYTREANPVNNEFVKRRNKLTDGVVLILTSLAAGVHWDIWDASGVCPAGIFCVGNSPGVSPI